MLPHVFRSKGTLPSKSTHSSPPDYRLLYCAPQVASTPLQVAQQVQSVRINDTNGITWATPTTTFLSSRAIPIS